MREKVVYKIEGPPERPFDMLPETAFYFLVA